MAKGVATDLHRQSAAPYDHIVNGPVGPEGTAPRTSSRQGPEWLLRERVEPPFECRPGEARPGRGEAGRICHVDAASRDGHHQRSSLLEGPHNVTSHSASRTYDRGSRGGRGPTLLGAAPG